MKSLTKTNLTLESFIQNVVDEFHRQCSRSIVDGTIDTVEDHDVAKKFYLEGKTVEQVAQYFVHNYQEFPGISKR